MKLGRAARKWHHKTKHNIPKYHHFLDVICSSAWVTLQSSHFLMHGNPILNELSFKSAAWAKQQMNQLHWLTKLKIQIKHRFTCCMALWMQWKLIYFKIRYRNVMIIILSIKIWNNLQISLVKKIMHHALRIKNRSCLPRLLLFCATLILLHWI